MLQEVSLVAAHGMDGGAEPGSRRAGLLENALVWGKVRKANQRGTENGKKKVFWGKKNWLKERVVKADYEIVPWVTGDIVLAWWRCWGMSGKRGQVISGWWRIVRSGGGKTLPLTRWIVWEQNFAGTVFAYVGTDKYFWSIVTHF